MEIGNGYSAEKNLGRVRTRKWKEFDDLWIHLDTIPECDRQTYRQTDWQMQYRVLHSMLTRDNKIIVHTYVRENGNYYSKFRVRVSIARTRSSL